VTAASKYPMDGAMNPRWRHSERQEKTCARCGQTKPVDEFYLSTRARGRLRQSWCVDCTKVAAADSAMRTAARRRGATVIECFSRADIFERDGGVCHVCGELVDPDNWHIDHLLPLSRGGQHVAANVAVAHPKCNGARRARPAGYKAGEIVVRDDQLGLWKREA